MKYKTLLGTIFLSSQLFCISGDFTIARIHYGGGGDWYADPSSLPNLLKFVSKNTSIAVNMEEQIVTIGDDLFYKNNYFYITGHGNIKLKDEEIVELRKHLLNGAFLHVDDNYGLDQSFRKTIKDIFPDKELVELPIDHEIFNIYYSLKNGLPKIHKHDNKRPQALGIFEDGKLIVLYTFSYAISFASTTCRSALAFDISYLE